MSTRLARPAALLAACLPLLAAAPAPAAAKAKLVARSYAVADLVVPITNSDVVPVKAPGKPVKLEKKAKTLDDQLITLLTHAVRPASWQPNGGPGTIDYYPLTMTLVVNQTPAVHKKIARLLDELRRQLDVEVALEVRLVTASDDCFEQIGVDFNAKPETNVNPIYYGQQLFSSTTGPVERQPPRTSTAAPMPDHGMKFLNDDQVRRLMETVQGDRRASVMQAPKVTMFNGQRATVDVTDTRYFLTGVVAKGAGAQATFQPKNEPATTGFRMTAQPVVSPDRRVVQVYLKMEQSDLASPQIPLMPITVPVQKSDGQSAPFTLFLQQPQFTKFCVDKAVAIPDGGTVLLGGFKKLIESRNEYGPPVLSSIPYVNRLFKNVGYGRDIANVFILVTPRVIVNRETEVAAATPPTPCGAPAPQACPTPCQAGPASGTLTGGTGYVVGGDVVPAGPAEELLPMPRKLETDSRRQMKTLAKLLKAYDRACAEGRTDEARKLAHAALSIDPGCFCRMR